MEPRMELGWNHEKIDVLGLMRCGNVRNRVKIDEWTCFKLMGKINEGVIDFVAVEGRLILMVLLRLQRIQR